MNRKLFYALIVLSCMPVAKAQDLIKAGPSVLVNKSFFTGRTVPAYGAEVAYEFEVCKKFSLNLATTFHYGVKETAFNTNIKQKDLLVGFHPEFRYHFTHRYQRLYVGIGASIQYTRIKNYFSNMPQEFIPKFTHVEGFLGITLGYFHRKLCLQTQFTYLSINPFIFVGYNLPLMWNTYDLTTRFGITAGINPRYKTDNRKRIREY